MVALSARVTEIRAIAGVLFFLPPPARNPLADKLHALGVRVHPELARADLVSEGPKELGNHAPQHVVARSTAEQQGMRALSKVNPALAARIEAAHADVAIATRIKAASTDQQRIALATELGIEVPAEVFGKVDGIKDWVDSLLPQDLE